MKFLISGLTNKVVFVFALWMSSKAVLAQEKNWAAAYSRPKYFIENKGQLDSPLLRSSQNDFKEFVYDEGGMKLFLSKKGIAYQLIKNQEHSISEKKEFDAEEEERKSEKLAKIKDLLRVEWLNANPNPEILTEEKSDNYFSYGYREGAGGSEFDHLYGYKKIIYKDLYPNIDLVYTFHPDGGLKYSFLLHPGSQPDMIKMKYSKTPILNSEGEISIDTRAGKILEHRPETYYPGGAHISSGFTLNRNVLSFSIENYDNKQEVILDPWVQTPAMANSNCVWECEKDGAGNVYIIGGDSPMQLLKYNSAGTLQWIFSTAYDTANDWLGTFATDLAGNSYVTSGSTAAITKVNSAGAQQYNVTGGSMDEYWNITFNCDQTKLVVGGTRLNAFPTVVGYGTIFDINTATGAVTATQNVGYKTPGGFGIYNPDEVRSITSSYNARYYYLILDSLGAIDQNFSACPNPAPLFKINNGYAFGYKCENWRPKGNSGIMAIRANKNFLYTQNGTSISKRSLMSGAILTTAAIPGGLSSSSLGFNSVGNSGIDIDSCGNVYVGSGNAVLKYDANLNLLSNVALPFHVYDVAVSYGGNVIASGSTLAYTNTGRTGYVQSVNMSACNPMTLFCCDATICPVGPYCTTSPSVTLTPVTSGGVWSGPGVSASGVFNPATAGAGTHSIVYTLACGSDSLNITVNPCATLTVCIDGSGNLNVSGGTPGYTWQDQVNVQNCSACLVGCTIPSGCAVNVPTWTTIATNTSSITPTTYPIRVTDSGGNSYTITTSGSVPNCTTTCTTPTISVTSSNSVTCFGASTGSATVSAAPAGTYTYTWLPGNLNGPSQSGLAAGVYSVTASSGGSCSSTTTLNIAQPTSSVTSSISTSSAANCGVNNGNATVVGSGGTGAYTYSWSPGGATTATDNGLAGGSYTVTVSDANLCKSITTVSISSTPAVTVTVNSATICAGSSATLTATGATTSYSWNPSTGLSSSTSSVVVATPTITTNYTVTGTTATCTGTAVATVSVNPAPTATASGTGLVCSGQTVSLNVNPTAGATYSWSGPNSFTSTTQNPTITGATASNSGVYTVTVTNNGCSASSTFSVTVNSTSSVSITPAGPYCSNSPSVTLNASITGGTWSGAGITNTVTGVFNPASAGTGTFTITYTLSGSCGSKDSIPIIVNISPTATASGTGLVCSGQTVSLNVNPTAGATYSWSGPNSFTSTTQNPTITGATASNSGVYTVTVTNNGCSATSTFSVTVNSTSSVSITPAGPYCVNSPSVTLNASITGGTWSGAGITNTVTGVFNPASAGTGTFTITYTLSGSCGSKDSIPIVVQPVPTASVTGSNTVCAGQSIGITVNATGGATYLWSGPSAFSAATQSVNIPNATSANAGTYYATVTSGGCSARDSISIAIISQPTVTVNSPSSCSGGTVSLTANGASNFTWTPGTGLSSNSGSVVIANVGSTTTFTVQGSTGGCLANPVTSTVTIFPNPTVTVNNTAVCSNTSVTLTVNGASSYSWSPGTGLSSTVGNMVIASPSSTTQYSVVGTDINGCMDTAFVTVLHANAITSSVSSTGLSCFGGSNGSATVTATGGTGTLTYSWTPVLGVSTSISNLSAGNYSCTVTDGLGCMVTSTVVIVSPAALSVTVASGIICAGQSFSLTAVVSGGTPAYSYAWSGVGTSNPNVVSPGTSTNYSVMVTDANGCTANDTGIIVALHPPLLVTAGDTTICGGNTAHLSAVATGGDGNYSYNWQPGGIAGQQITVTPAATTIYTVTVSDGCTSVPGTDTGVVTVTNVPIISLPNPSSGCAPLCVSITNPPGLSSWIWNFGDGTQTTSVNPNHCYTAPGSYSISITYTTTNGCASQVTSSNVVHVFSMPVANFNFSPSPADVLNSTVHFYNGSQNGTSWYWNFGDQSVSLIDNPSHNYTAAGNYQVMLVASNTQGCTDTIFETLVVNDIYTFYAPDAFSPNGDFTNEIFLPIGEGWDNSSFTLLVFDRWGNQIFVSQNPNIGWDGRIKNKGDQVQEDVYVWKVQLHDLLGKQHNYAGTVSLIK